MIVKKTKQTKKKKKRKKEESRNEKIQTLTIAMEMVRIGNSRYISKGYWRCGSMREEKVISLNIFSESN